MKAIIRIVLGVVIVALVLYLVLGKKTKEKTQDEINAEEIKQAQIQRDKYLKGWNATTDANAKMKAENPTEWEKLIAPIKNARGDSNNIVSNKSTANTLINNSNKDILNKTQLETIIKIPTGTSRFKKPVDRKTNFSIFNN